jgi:hypothetical protein
MMSSRLSTLEGGALDLSHRFAREMLLKEGAHVKAFPPAIENPPARFSVRFLPAIGKDHLLAEAAAARMNIVVVVVQHRCILALFGSGSNILQEPRQPDEAPLRELSRAFDSTGS